MQKTVLILSILMMAGMASAASSDVPKASQTPGDTFYFLDRLSESLELMVAKAPIIGSSELEAKVRANHAAERLAEARKLAENNRTEKVDQLMREYNKQTNLSIRSAKEANNTNLAERLGNVSNNHVEVLQDVRQKVPEQAQKGIQNAIENSRKNQRELGLPEAARDRGKPDIDTGPSDRKLNKTVKSENSNKPVNQTVGGIKERTEDVPDQINKTVPEEPADKEKSEDFILNDTEDELEKTVEKDSRITGNAVEEPSTPELP